MELKVLTKANEVINRATDERFRLQIRRTHVLDDSLSWMELATSNEMSCPIKVTFLGEPSVDEGGPTREFATLLTTHAKSSYLISGNNI